MTFNPRAAIRSVLEMPLSAVFRFEGKAALLLCCGASLIILGAGAAASVQEKDMKVLLLTAASSATLAALGSVVYLAGRLCGWGSDLANGRKPPSP